MFRKTGAGGSSESNMKSAGAKGASSHAEGDSGGGGATGTASHVEGAATTASGSYSHAEGQLCSAGSTGSHAEGVNSNASGYGSHAEGASTASNNFAHAEGSGTSASQTYAHAEGLNTVASGSASHAEGEACTASGTFSHAEGDVSTASGNISHAEGNTTTASAYSSHSEGMESSAIRWAQHSKGSGKFSAVGDAQLANFVARRSTTDATASILSFDASGTVTASGAATNVLTLAVARAFKFRVEVIARRTDTEGTIAGWTIEGVIARETGGNARIVGANITTKWADTGASTWTVTCTADTTNQCLAITATGEAAKTVRWVAALYTVEVG